MLAFAFFLVIFAGKMIWAATDNSDTWKGTVPGDWNTNANWDGNDMPDGNGNATFTGAGTAEVGVSDSTDITQIIFSGTTNPATAYTITIAATKTLTVKTGGEIKIENAVTGNQAFAGPGTLAFAGAGGITLTGTTHNVTLTISAPVTLGGNLTVTPAAGDSVILNGIVSGGAGIIKEGLGTLTLSGTNTFTGGLTITRGTVKTTGTLADTCPVTIGASGIYQVAEDDTIQSVTSASGGRVDILDTKTLTISDNSTVDFLDSSTGVATLNIGPKTLTLLNANNVDVKVTGGNKAVKITGTTGTVDVQSGILVTDDATSLGDGLSVNLASGASLWLGATETLADLTGAGSVALTGGLFDLTLDPDGTDDDFSGSINLAYGFNLGTLTIVDTANNNGTKTFSGAITAKSLTLDDPGTTITLSGTNTFSNAGNDALLITAGTLILTGTNTISGNINVTGKLYADALGGATSLILQNGSTIGAATSAGLTVGSGITNISAITNTNGFTIDVSNGNTTLTDVALPNVAGITVTTLGSNMAKIHGLTSVNDADGEVLTVQANSRLYLDGTITLSNADDKVTTANNATSIIILDTGYVLVGSGNVIATGAGQVITAGQIADNDLTNETLAPSAGGTMTIATPGTIINNTWIVGAGEVDITGTGTKVTGDLTLDPGITCTIRDISTAAVGDFTSFNLAGGGTLVIADASVPCEAGDTITVSNSTLRLQNCDFDGAVTLGAGVNPGTLDVLGSSRVDGTKIEIAVTDSVISATNGTDNQLAGSDIVVGNKNVYLSTAAGTALTILNNFTGTGNVLVNGSGDVVLAGTNQNGLIVNCTTETAGVAISGTQTGATTLTKGVLTINSGATLGAAITVTNDIDTMATLAGNGGSINQNIVAQNGGEHLEFTGTLTTTGALQIHNDGNFTVTAASGSTLTVGALTGGDGGDLLILDGPGTIVTSGASSINDAIYLTGGGTLKLRGNLSNPNADITVDGGSTLITAGDAQGFFTTAGDIWIKNGLHKIGNSPGITTVNGNYTLDQNGILEIEVEGPGDAPVAGVNHDQLQVFGTANFLPGSTIKVVGTSRSIQNAEIVAAQTIQYNGTNFANEGEDVTTRDIVVSSEGLYDAKVTYTTLGSVFGPAFLLTATRPRYEDLATNPVAKSQSLILEDYIAVGEYDQQFYDLVMTINRSSRDEAALTLNDMFTTTEAVPNAMASANLEAAGQFLGGIQRRAGALRRVSNLLASRLEEEEKTAMLRHDADALAAIPSASGKAWGAYVQGVGSWLDLDQDDGIPGASVHSYGAVLGFDGVIAGHWILGLHGGMAWSNLHTEDGSRGDIEQYELGLYGGYFTEGMHIDLHASMGWSDNEVWRQQSVRGIDYDFKGAYNSKLYSAGGEYGRIFHPTKVSTIEPFVNLNYFNLDNEAYTEDPIAGVPFHVSYEPIVIESMRTGLGLRMSYTFAKVFNRVDITPETSMAWKHECLDDKVAIRYRYGSAKFKAIANDLPEDYFDLSTSIRCDVTEHVSGFVRYDASISADFTNHCASTGVTIQF